MDLKLPRLRTHFLFYFGRLLMALGLLCNTTVCSSTATAADESEYIVFLAPDSPVFIRTRIAIDGIEFRAWLTDFLFDALDTNDDNKLIADELTDRVTQLLGSRDEIFASVDTNPSDKSISQEEFASFVADNAPELLTFAAQPRPQAQEADILPKLDSNQDGRISRDEVQNGSRSLSRYDLDDDQAFAASEMLPFRDPLNRGAAFVANTAALPFVRLGRRELNAAANRILQRYGEDGKPATIEGLQLSDAEAARYDMSGDGLLNNDELQQMLRKPPAHIELIMALPGRKFGRPGIAAKVLNSQNQSIVLEGREGRDRFTMRIHGLPVEMRVGGGARTYRADTRNFALQNFVRADGDKNAYLDESEYQMFGGLVNDVALSTFETADVNGDEMVTRDEVAIAIDRDVMLSQSRVVMRVAQDGKSLFQLLDENMDRRISLREFRTGFDRVEEFDANGDAQVDDTEFSSSYKLRFELGRPPLFTVQALNNNRQRTADANVPNEARLTGPRWFTRMDRNRDGDVSEREFLGPAELFQKADTDSDGLIDADEATAYSSP